MNKKQPIAYVICGYIGAGKTTFARKLEKETGVIRITKDEWVIRIFGNHITSDENFEEYDQKITELATDIALKILKAGHDVIIDEGFWNRAHRDQIKEKVISVGAKPILYYVECPVEKMRERVTNRSNAPPKDSFEISGEMFDSYLKNWHAPDKNEDVIVIKSSEL